MAGRSGFVNIDDDELFDEFVDNDGSELGSESDFDEG